MSSTPEGTSSNQCYCSAWPSSLMTAGDERTTNTFCNYFKPKIKHHKPQEHLISDIRTSRELHNTKTGNRLFHVFSAQSLIQIFSKRHKKDNKYSIPKYSMLISNTHPSYTQRHTTMSKRTASNFTIPNTTA